MLELAIIVGGISLVLAVGIVIKWGRLPPWTHRDMLSFMAMVATIGGAIIMSLSNHVQLETFTAQADRLITELVRDSHVRQEVGQVLVRIIDAQSFVIQWQTVGIIVVLLSLGLVISARTIKGKALGSEIELTTGDDGKPAIPVVVAQPKADPVPTTVEPKPAVDAKPPENKPAAPPPEE